MMKLFPDGFRALFAPAAALPALRFGLLPGRLPGAAPVVVPPVDDPVVALPVADPLAAAPAAVPVPLCAKAKVLVRANAAANPMLLSFMMFSLCSDGTKTGQCGDTFRHSASNESIEV